ncbi:MAG: cytochrome c [Bacteroidetes bacterium]|nr:cytochrome c [Bacteroidota bacterium]
MKIRILFFVFLGTLLSAAFIFYGFTSNDFLVQGKQVKKKSLPENPIEGRIVFENKGCINCHAINGSGGNSAPDLGKQNFFGSDYDLISAMWNHSPVMLNKMELKNIDLQKFNAKDFRSLRLFLYYLRYLGGSGNVNAGKKLFTKMNCANCHSIGKESSNKIRLDKIGVYASPVYLAQVMWNHAVKMQKMQKASNVKVPLFKNDEFADLSAYISSVSAYNKQKKIYMAPGNPIAGKKLFSDKGCYYCHNEKHIGPDLTKVNMNKSVTEIAGLMWNHSSEMEPVMQKNKIPMPAFKGNEMANLISFLYFSNQSKVSGSVKAGKQIILDKGCISCHSSGNSYKALDAVAIGSFSSEDNLSSELWNHLPLMEKNLYLKGKPLPTLLPSDVKSLYLYFNRKER